MNRMDLMYVLLASLSTSYILASYGANKSTVRDLVSSHTTVKTETYTFIQGDLQMREHLMLDHVHK